MGMLGRIKDRMTGCGDGAMYWTIITSAPKGEAGEQWGDTWFARDLVGALKRLGQQARVVSRAGANSPKRAEDEVVVVLRGLRSVTPPADRRGVWILWVISHPELVTEEEARSYDAVFVASESWTPPGGVASTPLLQATAAERFHPGVAPADSGDALLFVGSTRGQFRPAVRAALESARAEDLVVYGVGWEEFIAPGVIGGEFVANDELPAKYASAGIVLNDHHAEMAGDGFLSNRLFDAVATGTRVVSDRATGLAEVFGDVVPMFDDNNGLVELLARPVEEVFPDEQARAVVAERIRQHHSFDARAEVLLQRARELRGTR
jgi:hypothetical protein